MSTYTSKIFVTVDILVINNETEEILLIKLVKFDTTVIKGSSNDDRDRRLLDTNLKRM